MRGAGPAVTPPLISYSASIHARLAAGYSSYAPSKWALRGLADCLRNELQGTGVGISVAYPPDTGGRDADVVAGWGLQAGRQACAHE